MDTTKAAETRPIRGRNEGTATTDNFEQGQRVLVDLSAFNGHDGTALGTVRGADEYGRVVSTNVGVWEHRGKYGPCVSTQ